MWHHYVSDTSPPAAEYGWTSTSWIAALSAAPTSSQSFFRRRRLCFISFIWKMIKEKKDLTLRALRALANPPKADKAGERLKKFFPNECNNPKSKLGKQRSRLLDG
jgi:hypothetical protein